MAFHAALATADEIGHRILEVQALEGIARAAAATGDPTGAAILLGAASSLRQTLPWPVTAGDATWYEAAVESTRDTLGRAPFETAWRKGCRMTSDAAVRLALETVGPAVAAARPAGTAIR